MSEALQIAVMTALVNAAVTWGVISQKLAWLRRDVDQLGDRISRLERRRRSDRNDHHEQDDEQ